jgi:general secretion pathway protein D
VPAGQIAGPRAVAGGQADTNALIKISFQNAPPESWMSFYENLVRRTILRANALPRTEITLMSQSDLTREEAVQAMEHVLTLNGITAVKIGEKFVELVPSASALQSGGAFNKDPKSLAEAAQFVTQIVKLKYALASEVQQAVNPFARTPNGILAVDSTQTLVIRDYAINVKRMLEVIEEIDKEVPLDIELEVIPIRYALVADVSSVLGSLTSAGSITPTGTTGGTAGRTGSTTRRTTGGGLGVSAGGGAFGQPGQQGGFNPQQQVQRPGATITTQPGAPGNVGAFQSNLQRIVQNAARGADVPLLGDAKIIPDERSNSLIVFGTIKEREMLKKIVKEIDIIQPQVLIEAVVVEVQLTDGKDVGVSMGQTPRQFGADFLGFGGSRTANAPFGGGPLSGSTFTNLSQLGQGFSYFGMLGSNWEVAMTAVATDSRFQVLSRPRIQATHAVEADIFVGETRPFPTGSVSFGGQATTQIQNQRIGIGLNVLPLINVDGLVVMDIAQTVQQVGEEIQVDQFLAVPSIIDRSATSRVAVKTGDTIILGGFITTEKRDTRSGVPGLKDIPGLGRLFSSKSESVVKRELIVFLRPTVLETPEIAAITATNERDKMVDVKKTEIDLRREEQERYRKLEAEMEKANRRKK